MILIRCKKMMCVNILFDKMLFATTIFLYLCSTIEEELGVALAARALSVRVAFVPCAYSLFIYHKNFSIMKAKDIKQTERAEIRKPVTGKTNANKEQTTTSAQDANVTATGLAKSLLLAKSFEMAKAVCNMMASKDETKKESEYFKGILDSVTAENWQDCEKLVTRWTESTNESETFASRIVRTDETDKDHVKQLVRNVPENVVQIVSNLHSWFTFTEWKKTAKRNALLRKLKNMSLEELAELVGED